MKNKTIKVLHISPDFDYSCGVSKYVFLILQELTHNPDIELFYLTNRGDSLERLYGINVKVGFLKFKRGSKNIFTFLASAFQLLLFCLKYHIDLIHTHHRYPELLSILASKLLGIKTVHTALSFVTGQKLLSYKSDVIIAVSDSIKEYIIKNFGVDKSKIIRIYFFPDDKLCQPTNHKINPELSTIHSSNLKIILFVGRIGIIKGFDILIKALDEVRRVSQNFILIAVGSLEIPEFETEIRNRDYISYFAPTNDISDFYKIANLVVLPSRIDPFPFVMLETGLAKLPFIGGRTGGIEEFIEDGQNGILFTPGSVDELKNAILFILNNPEHAQRMANNLYNKVLPLTDSKSYSDELISIYESLLASNTK